MQDRACKLTKKIRSHFLVDASKLGRLLALVEGRFADFGGCEKRYQATLKSGRDLSVNSLEHVLGQDNTVHNPIAEFTIIVTSPDRSASALLAYDRGDSEIAIRVSSDDVKWGTELFGAIEEQVERSLLHSWVYSLKKLSAFLIPIALGLVAVSLVTLGTSSGPTDSQARRLLLSPETVEQLSEKALSVETAEDRLEFVYEYHASQVVALSSLEEKVSPIQKIAKLGWPAILVALPAVVVLGAFAYLLARCYPGSVFAWGDYEEHYKSMLDRRKFLWNAIVVALTVGVVANLAVYGASMYLPR